MNLAENEVPPESSMVDPHASEGRKEALAGLLKRGRLLLNRSSVGGGIPPSQPEPTTAAPSIEQTVAQQQFTTLLGNFVIARWGRRQPRPDYTFKLLQQWEGYVTAIRDGELIATVHDAKGSGGPEEEVVFDVAEVADGDLELLKSGSYFRWSIGYRTGPTKQKERVSFLKFVRLPAWSARDIKRVSLRASALAPLFEED